MKLTNKKLCDLCEKTCKVDMLQNGKGITEDIFKGVKKVKTSMTGLDNAGKKVVKDAVKLFNEGKISIEDAIKKVKPYVQQLMFKKGKGFTTADFTEHFGSGLRLPGKERCGKGYMEKNLPVGTSNSVGMGLNLPGPSGKGLNLPGPSGSGLRLPGKSGGSSITSVHSTISKGRGKGKPNAWVQHLKAYRAKHPNKSYKQCMQDAKATYKK